MLLKSGIFPLILSDSFYVAGIAEKAESTVLQEITNPLLFSYVQKLVFLLNNCKSSYFVMLVRSHKTLPGFIAEGNGQADLLILPVEVLPNQFAQAKLSPSFFHQNAAALQ